MAGLCMCLPKCACRKGDNIYKNYDIIIGAVANDDVFKTVDMYFRGI